MGHRSSDDAIFSLSTLIGLTAIVVAVIITVFACLIVISAPCVSNFYNKLPVYPGAELIEQKSSVLNWIALEDLEFSYHSTDDIEALDTWYQEMVDDVKSAAIRAQVADETIPVAWRHEYYLSTGDDGTDILLIASCLN